jgi:hypothetical protein
MNLKTRDRLAAVLWVLNEVVIFILWYSVFNFAEAIIITGFMGVVTATTLLVLRNRYVKRNQLD